MTCTVSIIEVQFLDIRASSACAPPSTGEDVDKFADIIGMAGMIREGVNQAYKVTYGDILMIYSC